MCGLDTLENPALVLASGSARRRQLLALLGEPFLVRPSDLKEVNRVGESPAVMAMRLSRDKARAVATCAQSGVVIGVDTLVCLDGKAVGKPVDPEHAADILRRLCGRSHVVFSGLTLIAAYPRWERTELAQTTVWMRKYSDEEIAAYVSSGDPFDKAGAYAIQHPGFAPVSRISGCYANVMGLPLCHLYRLLRETGIAPSDTPIAACDCFNHRICSAAPAILAQASKEEQRAVRRFSALEGDEKLRQSKHG